MIERLSGKLYLLFILGISVLLLCVSLLYFGLFRPLQADMIQVKKQIEQEETLIAAYTKQIQERQSQHIESTLELQKKVPTLPLVDQYLLKLREAEIHSDSFISNIRVSQANINDAEHMQLITFSMTVSSPDYEHMVQFIQNIEQFERITNVNSVTFSGRNELMSTINKDDPISYELEISTFYVEGLDDLVHDAPQASFINPAQKNNPLFIGDSLNLSLQLFEGQTGEHSYSSDSNASPSYSNAGNLPGSESDRSDSNRSGHYESSDEFTVQNPQSVNDLNYYVLQMGVFEHLQAASVEAERLRAKGWPVYLQQDILPYRVYSGMTTKFRSAMTLSQHYEHQSEDVYVRRLLISEVPQSSITETVEGYIFAGDIVLQYMSDMSVKGLSGQAVDYQLYLRKGSQHYHSFDQKADELVKTWPTEKSIYVMKMQEELTAMHQIIETADKGLQRNDYIQLQEHIMAYLLHYERLMYTLSEK